MAAIHCLGGFLKKTFFCLLVCVPFPVPLTSIPSFYFSSCPALAVLAALSSVSLCFQMSAGDLPKGGLLVGWREVVSPQPPGG